METGANWIRTIVTGTALVCVGHAQIVTDVSAVTNDPANAVTVRLGPGTWRATPIDATNGGAFTSWHPWNGVNTGCGATPGSCTQGWLWSYFLELPGQAPVHVRAGIPGHSVPKHATEQEAFDLGSVALWLPISVPTDVRIWIGDSVYLDNLGGVSLRFERVAPGQPSMAADVRTISVRRGGAQQLSIDGGAVRANNAYLVLGSSSGTAPGLTLGPWHIPLHAPDPWLDFTLASPNSAILVATAGRLDPQGRATARIVLPRGLPASLAGVTLHHAVVVFDDASISGVSAPVRLDLVR